MHFLVPPRISYKRYFYLFLFDLNLSGFNSKDQTETMSGQFSSKGAKGAKGVQSDLALVYNETGSAR